MRYLWRKAQLIVVGLLAMTTTIAETHAACDKDGLAVQVLGSGGPIADDARASSGYLLWQDGQALVLVDIGGGVFQRFGEAGANLVDLELIALTHFHTDHAADLPALLKSGYFSPRQRPLTISGPTGNRLMPSLGGFLQAMFGPGQGAFRYLSGYLDGSDGLFKLEPIEIDASTREPKAVLKRDNMTVKAVGVHHGPIPTLGYVFTINDRRIAIGGDQNLSRSAFVDMAKGVDLLIMPLAIPEDAGRIARNLHATPSRVGRAAAQIQPGQLVLSHFMARSLQTMAANLTAIRNHYAGPMQLAEDMACIAVEPEFE